MEVQNPVLVIDFNNMVHRARSGFSRGDNAITYTFLLMLRKTVEQFSPSLIYVVKEGRPQGRHDALVEYKANRSSAGEDFWRQHSDILKFLSLMPVKIVRHPHREADDTIAHIVRNLHSNDSCVVVSTDTDFIQLLSSDERVKLWNPTKQSWVEPFSCDYVKWKSLTGDGSDNIPGFKGIGGKTAEKILTDPVRLNSFLSNPENREKWERNQYLISFHEIEDEIEVSPSETNWESVLSEFTNYGFDSLVKEKTFKKYVETFRSVQ